MSHDINTSNAGPISATVSPAKLRILLTCGVIAASYAEVQPIAESAAEVSGSNERR